MLGLQNEREWVQFCQHVLQQPALATDTRFDSNAQRSANRIELQTLILETFAALTAAQVIERLDVAHIANARMNTMENLWAHPQLQARGRWTSVNSPAGELPALLPPGKQTAFDYRMDAIPKVGQHTEAILKELGIQR
jgi:crotonobetainyl-CoA:carnitine CoA-transferase CaiB-like acyl-CoA transferase